MRRFVVFIDDETPEDVSSFLEYAEKEGIGWWHWIRNGWLLTTNEKTTVSKIRDKILEITGNKTTIVLQVTAKTWSSYGIETEEKSISRWIEKHWSKTD